MAKEDVAEQDVRTAIQEFEERGLPLNRFERLKLLVLYKNLSKILEQSLGAMECDLGTLPPRSTKVSRTDVLH